MVPHFPSSIIIIGAGIFGLSTALAISKRHPACNITIIDRLTPPVEDGTSVDTTRCIRSDYADPLYARLARDAQQRIEQDSELSKHYFKQGMSFIVDGKPGHMNDLWVKGISLMKEMHSKDKLIEMTSPEQVFQRIHGSNAQLVPASNLPGDRMWNVGYCNLEDAYIDAKECIRVYFERCLTRPSIAFRCGIPVDHIRVEHGHARGVALENGESIDAACVLVAAGAWSPKLIDLQDCVEVSAVEVAWVKLTPEEVERWKNMSITTNYTTGFNLFPPHNGEMKMLRRGPGFKNTVRIPHPEQPDVTISAILPRTIVTNPGDMIPLDTEQSLHDELREIMPEIADRPFDRTKVCWLSTTPTSDFIVAPHPRISGIHAATGGSAHAWKFLTNIGDLVTDSIEGRLDDEYKARWAWVKTVAAPGHSHRLEGEPRELSSVVRSSL